MAKKAKLLSIGQPMSIAAAKHNYLMHSLFTRATMYKYHMASMLFLMFGLNANAVTSEWPVASAFVVAEK